MALFHPAWELPADVGAVATTRSGGVSAAPWHSLNLGGTAGDDPQAVLANRRSLASAIAAEPVWLHQVHGAAVVRLQSAATRDLPAADAAWTTDVDVACAVLAADCLPVLLCTSDGRAVAAAHAGWRGLAAGVLEATLVAMHQGAGVRPDELLAWLGPSIGPQHFEVGADVLQAFGAAAGSASSEHFQARPRADGAQRWLADLPALAAQRLRQAGVQRISIDGRCTVAQTSDFFSFRRDGRTGRQAALIWRRAG